MWVPATELAKAPGHPFYQRLNRVLGKHGFDDFVEAECAAFYTPSRGGPAWHRASISGCCWWVTSKG